MVAEQYEEVVFQDPSEATHAALLAHPQVPRLVAAGSGSGSKGKGGKGGKSAVPAPLTHAFDEGYEGAELQRLAVALGKATRDWEAQRDAFHAKQAELESVLAEISALEAL